MLRRAIFTLCLLTLPTAILAQPMTRVTSVRCEDGTLPTTAPIAETFGAAGNNEIIALSSGKQARIFYWMLQSTADVQLKFVQGTGTDCATGEGDVVGRSDPFSTVNRPVNSGILAYPYIFPASKAVCLDASAAATITGVVVYCLE